MLDARARMGMTRSSCAWLLAALLLAGRALAQSSEAEATPATEAASPPEAASAPAPAEVASAPAPPAASGERAEAASKPDAEARPEAGGTESLGPFERLPASAYPEPRVRGIRGGSLWMTFHGLQWPYYRKSGIGVSGYVWIDTGYERLNRGNPSEQGIKYVLQQGRLLLRVTPTYSKGDFFVQGQAELVANKDQSQHQPDIMDADDVWIRTGLWNGFDVQLGRFEGWEVYHFGMGLDLNTLERRGAFDDNFSVPDIYGVTYAFYRPPGVGQAALHLYPTDYLRFELGTQLGNEFGSNTLAARPVGILDLGWLKFKLGGEYKRLTDQKDNARGETSRRGAGAALQFIVDPRLEFGVNAGYGISQLTASDGTMDEKGSTQGYSVGGFANLRVVSDFIVGAGANLTRLRDNHYDQSVGDYGRFGHLQTFVALQYLLFGQLYVKTVLAYARGEFRPTFGDPIFNNSMLSARLRLMYLF